ncbi:hypothetical protein AB9F26_09260 [Falsihalocynthiibacter sp. BN13B15]|uniref:hypothetical protein n=1 Tax=Falsihalocynthiibacter sp. BN13B15 TaxID=3240871 RepID=UPI0035107BE7
MYDKQLQCNVLRETYDAETKTGILILDETSCPDMDPSIAHFQAIDPSVKKIYSINDIDGNLVPNTQIWRDDGQWKVGVYD